ncbi:toll/interleukin-1 receptor domain-containing protein [Thioalkalivibrio sp. XN8]|uniref:tetratricopeptide repeat protein n=1 Tax=Thioalkalivibrio sp. XN8 TaxID=2712863 RepID=UPI0013EA45EA|nr:toll/interleukin-1 receptor domain-containing protein [Thioalkalivibrio sp. XN8]
MVHERRYRAFISYSHADKAVAKWLHRALERYRLPSRLVGEQTETGPVPARLTPIFRDRDEISAGADLSDTLRQALADSMFLIVVASPDAAASRWVNEEVRLFKSMHGETRVLALIAAGDPGERGTSGVFPPALRFRVDPEGQVTDNPTEPVAADLRAGADGRRLAKLKLVAGLTALPLDALVQRESARRQRWLLGLSSASLALVAVMVVLTVAAIQGQREAERQRAEAQAEAAKVRAVNQFMRDTLSAANPWGAGYDVSVVEALDQASDKIAAAFVEQPEVEAEVRQTIGNAYNNLGRYDRARPLLVAAAEARIRLLGGDDPETIETLAALAQLAWRESRFDEAIERTDELLELRRGVFGDPSPEVGTTLDFLGRLLTDAGHYEAADRVTEEALAMSLALHGEQSLEVAACYQTKAVLAQIAHQDYALAEALSRREIEIRRAVSDTDTMETASALNNLGIFVMLQGRLEEAQPILEEAVALDRRLGGAQHPELARALENLGNVHYRLGNIDRTLELLAEVIAIRREGLGDDNPEVARTLHNRGMVLSRAGDLEGAEAALRDAVARMERAYGPDHPDVASGHRSLSYVLQLGGKLDLAEAELRTALAIAERAFAAASPGLAGYRQALGGLLVTRQRYEEAEPLLLAVHASALASDGAGSQRAVATAGALVALYEAWGKPQQAEPFRPR